MKAPQTVGEGLARSAEGGGSIVLVDGAERERRVPFAELHARAKKAAGFLLGVGVRPGDRVAVVAPTGLGFLDAYFGATLAGAVPVPLYPPVRLGKLSDYHAQTAAMLSASGARLVVADPQVRLLLGESLAKAPPALGCVSTEALSDGGDEAHVGVSPEALGLVQFSSGSTSAPKPVALSHRALAAQCDMLPALFPGLPPSENVGCSWLPLYHDMGLIGCLLTAVHHGGTLVLLPPERFLARPSLWLRAIARHRATVSPAPNFAYAVCEKRVRDDELAGLDLSSWKHALCGAEPVAPDVLRRFARRFSAFGLDPSALRPVYGLAEAALAVTASPAGRALFTTSVDPHTLASRGAAVAGAREIASVGVPAPGVKVEIRGEGGEVLPDGIVGAIFVASPSLMEGYLGQAEATSRVLSGGFLDTGDLGFLKGGELFIAGRAKDVVVVRGANHAPQELEAPAEEVPGVRPGCVAAVGFEPEGGGEEVLLLLERASGAEPGGDAALADAARAAVLARTGIRPHTVVVLEPGTLPRTSSGKLRRREALARFLAGTLAPPEKTGAGLWARALARSAVGHVAAAVSARQRG